MPDTLPEGSTAPEVQIIQGPPARKLYKLAKRVSARKGFAVGMLSAVSNQLRRLHVLFQRAIEDNDKLTISELDLTRSFVQRLDRRVKALANARVTGAQEMLQVVEQVSRQLAEADRGGYQIARMQRQADSDRKVLDRLRTSLRARVTESAMILAELEQAVDPVPEFRMVPARQRAANRKERDKQKRPLAIPPGVETPALNLDALLHRGPLKDPQRTSGLSE